MKKTIITIATAAIILPTAVFAGEHNQKEDRIVSYNGPVETVTVASLMENNSMFAETKAVVEGTLIKQISADTFIFSDGKDTIQIELDDDIIVPHAIDANTKVRLFGEFEGGNTPEIEVDQLQVL
ncbi:hypothetical protein ABT56_19850 [Photobacterium aquae]|uniref:Uncharacterized protein n=1 Tax=Photobacterium aquae TaxID=1195763 RepID=A0A0J1GUM6_9GAMM|nr:NirD/YgiW/YdeI family stress tolerance protein [Photobacterium aquae]KLV03435.1 hypothetical protein ABT56_19850 [Photobacterium aquae]